ncbi:hypothetical protein [Paenibacillus stellifer]|uniref:hypothetical protein n=1 Tax=Paenibacillus stellifer TaxID=169760 RepID=UPI000A613A6D|nr:hypothetical protein [Paenibacillus stellifer]
MSERVQHLNSASPAKYSFITAVLVITIPTLISIVGTLAGDKRGPAVTPYIRSYSSSGRL